MSDTLDNVLGTILNTLTTSIEAMERMEKLLRIQEEDIHDLRTRIVKLEQLSDARGK